MQVHEIVHPCWTKSMVPAMDVGAYCSLSSLTSLGYPYSKFELIVQYALVNELKIIHSDLKLKLTSHSQLITKPVFFFEAVHWALQTCLKY